VNTLLVARHAHAAANAEDVVNAVPPGLGLSAQGVEEARSLGQLLAAEPIELGVSSRLRRTSETLELALAGRDIPRIVEPLLDEIGFGSFEGGALADYRAWAWKQRPDAGCPGGGETRATAAARIAEGLVSLLERPEGTILAVTHGLPLRYILDAADGRFPSQRLARVPHAVPYRLERATVELAADTLRDWAAAPRFTAPTPSGG
jgi:broad specificity phosphatase PhoE